MRDLGGASIFGHPFPDENLKLRHNKRGQLTMANNGTNRNGSRFFITFDKAEWLDGYQTVFGELIEGDDVLRQIESTGNRQGEVSGDVVISDCGESH